MITILIGGLLFLYLTYNFISSYKSKIFINSKDIVLIVIAHPDDECMFFAPTILNLLKEGFEIYLLCLSSGGFRKKSNERKRELRESCNILGIPSENVFIIEHGKLPDNPDMAWNKGCVAHIIRKYFVQLSAKIIFSFDEYGISGHLNHIAICQGLKYLKAKELLPRGSQVFQLKSVLWLLKYLAFLGVPICLLCSSLCFISTGSDVQKTWVREWTSALRKEGHQLDRQIRSIQREEEKVKRSLKEAAKKGDADVCKILAREIVTARKSITRIYTSKAHINSVQMSMNHQLATLRVAGSLEKSTEVMKSMQNLVKIPEIARTMQDLSKEMMKAGIIEEMMEDTFESLDDQEELEEEAQLEVDKVLWELTAGQLGTAPVAVSESLPDTEAEGATASSDHDTDLSEMQERLEALRS